MRAADSAAAADSPPGVSHQRARTSTTTTILRSMPLYGDECLELLRRIVVGANEKNEKAGQGRPQRQLPPRPASAAQAATNQQKEEEERIGLVEPTPPSLSFLPTTAQAPNDSNRNDERAETTSLLDDDDDNEQLHVSSSESDDDPEMDDDTSSGSSSSSSSSNIGGSEDSEDDVVGPEASGSGAANGGPIELEPISSLRPATATATATVDEGVDRRAAKTAAQSRGAGLRGGKKTKERRAKIQAEYRRHLEQIPCRHFEVPMQNSTDVTAPNGTDNDVVLCVSSCVWPDRDARDDLDELLSRRYVENETTKDAKAAQSLLSLLRSSSSSSSPSASGFKVVIWWMRSGRFAGGVFVNEACVSHVTKARYTIRKGQGKSQGAMDNQKGKNAKSVGAQLRRAGQVQLWDDVRTVAISWEAHLRTAHLVLVMVPNVMHATLWKDTFANLLEKDDDRVRARIPLNVKKPGYDSLVLVHRVVTTCTIRKQPPRVVPDESGSATETPKVSESATNATKNNEPNRRGAPEPTVDWPPLTKLHEAAAKGQVEALVALLGQPDVPVNAVAGPLLQTPLHVAASAGTGPELNGSPKDNDEDAVTKAMEALSTSDKASSKHSDAAECVYQLLVTGRADPTILDVRGRPPYFLAAHDTVRIAFRRARAALEKDNVAWDWNASKIGPALTDDDLEAKKEREAEKKRQKKQRQKERKAKDKADAEAAERQRQQQVDEQQKQEEAKRIRDGLQPKLSTKATNVCDYCQKVCVGKRRRDMYQRLEYAYCSTECVQLHKRELMAGAALARFQSSG